MEFLELLNEVNSLIPPQGAEISRLIGVYLPYVVLGLSLITCFFGYKLHKIWLGFLFFVIGFFIGFLPCIFFESDVAYYVFLGVGVLVGILAASISHKFHKLSIFLTNFFFAFAVLPDILALLLDSLWALILGFVLAVLIGVFAAKYKYLVTIITTGMSGAIGGVPLLMNMLGITNNLIIYPIAVFIGLVGIGVQFACVKKEIGTVGKKVLRTR